MIIMSPRKRRRTLSETNPAPSAAAAMAPPPTGASPISDLPDHLFHHVISFLHPQTASKLCILSKRFHSVWNSTPSLSFHHSDPEDDRSCAYGAGSAARRDRFLDYIHSTLARRTPGVTLDKFQIQAAALEPAAFKGDDDDAYHDHRVDAAIDYALSSGVRVLDLDLGAATGYQFYHFPPRILTAANTSSLTALRLAGLDLDRPGPFLIVDYPLLADLTLSRSSGIRTLEISCPRLKSIDVDSCVGLKSLTLDSRTSNLESFSFVGTRGSDAVDADVPYDLKIAAACPSLARISVSKVLVSSDWVANVAAQQWSLNELRLSKFEPLKGGALLFGHSDLQLIELEILSKWVVRVQIRAPNLQTLNVSYKAERYSREFDISGCRSLKDLELSRVWMTDEWIRTNIPNFPWLKRLKLNHCCNLNEMMVYHQGLERLALVSCDKLKKIEVVAVSLQEFEYSSSVVPHELVMGASGRLLARLELRPGVLFGKTSCFGSSIEFLKAFGQCRKLTLVASRIEDLTIDEILREGKTAPMYDLRGLEVEIKCGFELSREIVDLVDSLLWLAPHVTVLSLLTVKGRKTLKLNYCAQRDAKDKEALFCCKTWWPIKCWRHILREVTMDNFNPMEKENLVDFFSRATTNLEAVYDSNQGTIFSARRQIIK